jgi:uncharacterized protein DUF4112
VAERNGDLVALARALDAAVRIPGTNVRVGIDAVIGLVPGVGDVAGSAIAAYIVLAAARRGAPPSLLARMLLNVAVDTALGAVPVIGDVFDVAWRANSRNVALLERHVAAPGETRAASGFVVGAVLLGIVLLLAAGIALAWLGLRALARA